MCLVAKANGRKHQTGNWMPILMLKDTKVIPMGMVQMAKINSISITKRELLGMFPTVFVIEIYKYFRNIDPAAQTKTDGNGNIDLDRVC